VHGDLGPNRDPIPIPASGAVPEQQRTPDRSGIKNRVSARLKHFDAIHAPSLCYPNPEEGLSLHVRIPEVQRILDGDLTIKGSRIFHFRPVPTPQEKDREYQRYMKQCNDSRQTLA